MTRWRWLALLVLVVAAVFAWNGGTFSQGNYLALKREAARDSARAERLSREVDSLKAFRDSLGSNPMVQERVARQLWGMQWPGELTFTIERDSGGTARKP